MKDDLKNFIDEKYKVLKPMYTDEIEGVELASYKLKDVANVWYNQWEESRGERAEHAAWEEFEIIFLDLFFPQELRKVKVDKFVI